VPPTVAYTDVTIWYRFVALTGAYAGVLGPDRATNWYQLPSLPSTQAKGTSIASIPATTAAGTFGSFSSSGSPNRISHHLVNPSASVLS